MSSGWPLVQIAGELGLSPSMRRNGRTRSGGQKAGSAAPPRPASAASSLPDPRAEIARLRRENERVRRERDI